MGLKSQIMSLKTRGGTSLSEGIDRGTALFEAISKESASGPYASNENRMFFLTDMMPNSGDTDGKHLFNRIKKNADDLQIYTTFIGVGIDFNTDLATLISKVRACNHLSVQSAKDFKRQMGDEFDYLVTPIVFDCSIDVEGGGGWDVERVYGSPGFEIPEKGRLLFMDSQFPTPKEGTTMTKGAIVVCKLKPTSGGVVTSDAPVKLRVTYKDKHNKEFSDTEEFRFASSSSSPFQDTSIRKAVLLLRYVNFMKHFIRDCERADTANTKTGTAELRPSISLKSGIGIPSLKDASQKEDQHRSAQLRSLQGSDYQELFQLFSKHFEDEMRAIGDETLEKEFKQLTTIRDFAQKPATEKAAAPLQVW